MQTVTVLQNKRIVLAVTGSIAVYKAVDLASQLTQAGAIVDVVMTQAAQRFVTPLTFQAVTGRPVYTDMWRADVSGGLDTHVAHVGLGEGADLLAVIPATAHTLAKLAHGLADNLLAVTALASRGPLLVAPAMDGGMYSHPATQANIETLVQRGARLIEPESGHFASGLVGKGRLPDTPTLIGHMRRAIGREGVLNGRKVVVSAGGTREAIDPVRFISNHSSGRQGFAIAQAALDAGAAEVVLVTTTDLPAPVGATVISVASAVEMRDAILEHSADADGLVMAAAVADYRPAQVAQQKIKKTSAGDDLTLNLTRNPDILLDVKAQRIQSGFPRVVVGFAAESENLLANAQDKLTRKGLDLIAANDISATDAGFGVDNNRVVLIDSNGQMPLDLTSKALVAEEIMARLAGFLSKSG